MQVGQIHLAQRVIGLESATTKIYDGQEVTMTNSLFLRLNESISGKRSDDRVFMQETISRCANSVFSAIRYVAARASVGFFASMAANPLMPNQP